MRNADLLLQKGMVPWLAPYAGWLLDVLDYNGVRYTITSVLRSREKQAQLYRRYLEGKSQYPAAPPGRSMHEHGRAVDVVADDWALAAAGRLWQQMGGVWGGTRDPIHFHA